MFPFSKVDLRNRIWHDKAAQVRHNRGWYYYSVDRSGNLKYEGPFPARGPDRPGLVVQYWIPPDEMDWQEVLAGLVRAMEASGMVKLY